MNSNTPNLFHFATKELSQDALICWLIEWTGQPQSATKEDEELRRCGLRFVNALLNHRKDEQDRIELKSVSKVEILQQERSIDVLVRINEEHVLLIEDKTHTKDHSNQLSRYYGDVVEGRTKLGEVKTSDLYPVYFKTGNQPLADDHRIEALENCNYTVFNRKDFLSVLNEYKGCNAILLDFRKYLQELEDDTNGYAEWTSSKGGSWMSWEGFCRCLEYEWSSSGRWIWWGYVSNPSGGFHCFSFAPSDDSEQYLQIEARLESGTVTEAKLCFKVEASETPRDQRQDLKRFWHARAVEAGGGRVVKPDRMRVGNTMTVGWWNEDWMVFDKDNSLDLAGTIENLKQAEEVLQAAVSSNW